MCSRLRKPLAAVEEEHKAWLEVARLCADDEQTWALEVSYLSNIFTACALTLTCKAYAFGCGGSCCTTTLTMCRALCS